MRCVNGETSSKVYLKIFLPFVEHFFSFSVVSPLITEVCQLIDTNNPKCIRLLLGDDHWFHECLTSFPLLSSPVSIEYGKYSQQPYDSFADLVHICTTRFSDIRKIVTKCFFYIVEGLEYDDGEKCPTFEETLCQMDKNTSNTINVDLQIKLDNAGDNNKYDSRIFTFGECLTRTYAATSRVDIHINEAYINDQASRMMTTEFILDVAKQYLISDLTIASALEFGFAWPFSTYCRNDCDMSDYIHSIGASVSGGDPGNDVFDVPTDQVVMIVDRQIVRQAIGHKMCTILDEAGWELTSLEWVVREAPSNPWTPPPDRAHWVKVFAKKSGKTACLSFADHHVDYESESDNDINMDHDDFYLN